MELVRATEEHAIPVREPADLRPLIDHIRDARVVMLGESTHGTAEFYRWRRMITEWLIVKHGFNFIAVEGEWPACRPLDRYARLDEGCSARESLAGFHRWPTWMWANTEIVRMTEWLRQHNDRQQRPDRRAAFHGLDLYSLFDSMDLVVRELEKVNLFYARQARLRYACFDSYGRDEYAYARAMTQLPASCETHVVQVLKDALSLRLQDPDRQEALLDVQQNARVVRNAERYYRATIHADEASWNIRDEHMMETLEWLLEKHGPESRGIVWAHNTHIGDYRATDMRRRGLVNLGGLARERLCEEQVALVGFGTYEGKVTASHAWEGPIEIMNLPPTRQGSYESAFHEACSGLGSREFYLIFERDDPTSDAFLETRGHRAVGVVYDPSHDRWGHYVPTQLARRYDAFFFIDETTAVQPIVQHFDAGELPGTWPMGQ